MPNTERLARVWEKFGWCERLADWFGRGQNAGAYEQGQASLHFEAPRGLLKGRGECPLLGDEREQSSMLRARI